MSYIVHRNTKCDNLPKYETHFVFLCRVINIKYDSIAKKGCTILCAVRVKIEAAYLHTKFHLVHRGYYSLFIKYTKRQH